MAGHDQEGRQGYRKILAWQRAHALALLVYEKTKQFPKAERYGLTQQLRRAALSVPANIVEGYARNSTQQYLYHLNVAYGSLAEVEYFFNSPETSAIFRWLITRKLINFVARQRSFSTVSFKPSNDGSIVAERGF